MEDTARLGLRLKARVREALEVEAQKQNRTLSNVVETLLIERLKELGYNL